MRCFKTQRRPGNVLVLSLLLMVPMFAMLAFAVDVGYLAVVKTELQRTADAAAIAATWELLTYDENAPEHASQIAQQYATLNPVLRENPYLGQTDVTVGFLADASSTDTWNFDDPQNFNAARVTVRRDSEQNGSVPLFFVKNPGH